ncbi:MAG: hypothetical protein JKY14_13640, partial [Paraglaciecola sp.]|nr:hypothetical protein [Paraglaciecola sp.]
MKRSIIVVIGIAIFVIVVGLVSTTFVMSRYQLSLPTLINKIAIRFSLIEGGELLISPDVKYAQTSTQDMVVKPYPRILATQLSRWNAVIPPEYFTQRIDMINRQRLGFSFNCASNTLGHLLNCYVNDPSERTFEALVAGLISFEFVKPTVNDSKSNAWLFAFVVDVVMTSDKLRGGQRRQLDQRLRLMLNHYLVMLDDDWASLWHSRSTLSAQAFLLATVLDRSAQDNQQLYRRALGHFHQTYQALASTEVWPEGYNYWINNRALLAVLAMSAYANSHQLSMDRTKVISTIKRIGLVHIYRTRPDFKIEGWADEGPRIDLKDETAKVIDLIAQITQEQVFYQFARAIRRRYGEESYYRSYRWMLPWLYTPDLDAFGLSVSTNEKSKKQLLLPLSPLLPNSALFGKNMVNQM